MKNLFYIELDFTIEFITQGWLSAHTGSAIRGVLGHIFKKSVCVGKGECDMCILRFTCPYSYVFETPIQADSKFMKTYPFAPHPFIFQIKEEKEEVSPGDIRTIHLNLVGEGIKYLPYFVFVFQEMQNHGLGRDKVSFKIKQISSMGKTLLKEGSSTLENAETLLMPSLELEETDSEENLKITFLSPCSLTLDRKRLYKPDIHSIIANVLRKYSSLQYFHNNHIVEGDFSKIVKESEDLTIIKDKTYPCELKRYSSRQNTKVIIDGFIGEIKISGKVRRFKNIFEIAQIINIGKGAAYGLGWIKADFE